MHDVTFVGGFNLIRFISFSSFFLMRHVSRLPRHVLWTENAEKHEQEEEEVAKQPLHHHYHHFLSIGRFGRLLRF